MSDDTVQLWVNYPDASNLCCVSGPMRLAGPRDDRAISGTSFLFTDPSVPSTAKEEGCLRFAVFILRDGEDCTAEGVAAYLIERHFLETGRSLWLHLPDAAAVDEASVIGVSLPDDRDFRTWTSYDGRTALYLYLCEGAREEPTPEKSRRDFESGEHIHCAGGHDPLSDAITSLVAHRAMTNGPFVVLMEDCDEADKFAARLEEGGVSIDYRDDAPGFALRTAPDAAPIMYVDFERGRATLDPALGDRKELKLVMELADCDRSKRH